jgi:hypothetical protein
VNGRDRLREGENFLTYVNPYSPTELVACDSKGSVVAVCPLWESVSRNDERGVASQMGRKKQLEADALRNLGIRHIDGAERKAAMHANNAAVLTGQPATEAERLADGEEKARLKTTSASLNDFLVHPTNKPDEGGAAPDLLNDF